MTRTVFLPKSQAGRILGVPHNPKRKKSGKGHTAMRHARAVCREMWPGIPLLEASKSIVWIPDDNGPCPRCGRNVTPRSKREDLYGCFDLFVLNGPLIQVTTEHEASGGGAASTRKKKIAENFIDEYRDALTGGLIRPEIQVWSWVARKHFKAWRYEWDIGAWSGVYLLESPEIKGPGQRKRRDAEPPNNPGPPF